MFTIQGASRCTGSAVRMHSWFTSVSESPWPSEVGSHQTWWYTSQLCGSDKRIRGWRTPQFDIVLLEKWVKDQLIKLQNPLFQENKYLHFIGISSHSPRISGSYKPLFKHRLRFNVQNFLQFMCLFIHSFIGFTHFMNPFLCILGLPVRVINTHEFHHLGNMISGLPQTLLQLLSSAVMLKCVKLWIAS